jgi:hypothetical protein
VFVLSNGSTDRIFHTREELKEYLTNHFKISQVTEKDRLDIILNNGFDTGFFSIECYFERSHINGEAIL